VAMEKQFSITISLFDMMEVVNIRQLIQSIYKQMNLGHDHELSDTESLPPVAAE
jgi:hypothetical protein